MLKLFRIGLKICGSNKISVYVEYTIKFRQINISTFINALNVILLDGDFRRYNWVLRFLVPLNHHLRYNLINLLEQLIQTVFITDDVLFSIGAQQLMKFKNKLDQHYIDQQVKEELDCLKQWMLLYGINIIEDDDLFFASNLNDKPDLAMFRYSKEDEANCDSASLSEPKINIQGKLFIVYSLLHKNLLIL